MLSINITGADSPAAQMHKRNKLKIKVNKEIKLSLSWILPRQEGSSDFDWTAWPD
jgi:hypothetical protein